MGLPGKITVEVRETYPGSQWCAVRVYLPGYGAQHPGFILLNLADMIREYGEDGAADLLPSEASLFRPEYAQAIKAGLERHRHLEEALKDLMALYAATPGHDPNFISKARAALGQEV